MRPLIFSLAFLLLPLTAGADTYWVDNNGTASWSNCKGATALSGSSACSISRANSNVSAGDIVYMREGTYSTGIAPSASGSSGNEITYSTYNREAVTLSGMNIGVNIGGRNYINVVGITVTGTTYGLLIDGGKYNTISYSTFGNHTGGDWDANYIFHGAEYNHIHHCTFHTNGQCTGGGSDDGAVIRIGSEDNIDDTKYNLVEDSTFYHGGHHVFGLHGNHNVIRNNYMYNEAWTNGAGNRTLYITGMIGYSGNNLVEGNRFGYAAAPCDDVIVGNVAMSTPSNIFRYNYMYHHNAYGLGFGSYSGYEGGANNRIYNNTIHNSGYNIHPSAEGSSEDASVLFYSGDVTGNVLKNNLYNIQNQKYGFEGASIGDQIFANEFDNDANGDPLFANASGVPPADKSNISMPDFTLSASSPAIDFGGALTTVAGSDTGSGTTLKIDDAKYFQDGTWARPGRVNADWIAVGTVSNTVRIISINYSTNTLMLDSAISRQDGDDVWLFKNSSGTVVLYGSRPDAGASEYGEDTVKPNPPSNLKVIDPQAS